jgi:hypothetical protein
MRLIIKGASMENMKLLMLAVENVNSIAGANLEMEIDPEFPALPKRRGRGPRVQYRSLVSPDHFKTVLEGIGEKTWEGVIFTHIHQSGPCTEKQLRGSIVGLKQKAAESAIHRLKGMTWIQAEELGTTDQPADDDEIIIIGDQR